MAQGFSGRGLAESLKLYQLTKDRADFELLRHALQLFTLTLHPLIRIGSAIAEAPEGRL